MIQNTLRPQPRPMLFQEVGISENWMFISTFLSYTTTHHSHLNSLDKLWFCFSRYMSTSANRPLCQEYRFFIIGYASSFDMAWRCIMLKNISVACLSLSGRAYPFLWFAIRHLQRLALDVVCHDCHWCACMQADWYASCKDMSRWWNTFYSRYNP